MDNNKEKTYEIDILHLLKKLWEKVWLILIVAVLCGAIAFGYTYLFIKPMYSASTMVYVNNKTLSVGQFSITGSDLTASQGLISTYMVLLRNRTTLEQLRAEKGLSYSAEELNKMISGGSVNNTSVFRITVTCRDPYDAAEIANGIAEILPKRVEAIMEGASMRVVDTAVVSTKRVSPSYTRNTEIGFLLGFVLICAVIVIRDLLDDIIHSEEYLTTAYEDIPVLASIPDMTERKKNGRYGYYKNRYYQRGSYGGAQTEEIANTGDEA